MIPIFTVFLTFVCNTIEKKKSALVMICFGSSPLGSFNLAFSLKALIDRYEVLGKGLG